MANKHHTLTLLNDNIRVQTQELTSPCC